MNMKKEIVKVSLVIITFCMIVDCTPDILGHEDNPVDTLVKPENPPQNFSVSGCKSTTRGLFENETIEYEARENGLLRIMHNNVLFNCEVIQIYAEMTVNGHTYIVEEKAQEGPVSVNCVCPYDLGYDIGPLTEGEEYTVSIRKGKSEESEVAKFIFTYSPSVKGQISRK